jgi:hypothetical protein
MSPLPKYPVETSQKQRKVRVVGEKVERRNGTITVRNPKTVEVVQTGSRRKSVGMSRTAIPARAVTNHFPTGPGEIELTEGQPTLYLGTNSNGWARVKHADGREGYVPHSYLSQI